MVEVVVQSSPMSVAVDKNFVNAHIPEGNKCAF